MCCCGVTGEGARDASLRTQPHSTIKCSSKHELRENGIAPDAPVYSTDIQYPVQTVETPRGEILLKTTFLCCHKNE